MQIDDEMVCKFRQKLRTKVRYHVGRFCPDAEDLVQETLVRFLRLAAEERIRNPASLGAFLNGVCNNVILEYRRRLWREEPYEPESPQDQPATESDPALMETRQAVDAALAELSDRDHILLRSFYLEGKTKEEICSALSTTDATFRVALFRAKERFRKIYRKNLKPRAAERH